MDFVTGIAVPILVAAISVGLTNALRNYTERQAARRRTEERQLRKHLVPTLKHIEDVLVPGLVEYWEKHVRGYRVDIPYRTLNNARESSEGSPISPPVLWMVIMMYPGELLRRISELSDTVHPKTLREIEYLSGLLSPFEYINLGTIRLTANKLGRERGYATVPDVIRASSLTDDDFQNLPNLLARSALRLRRRYKTLSNPPSWGAQVWTVYQNVSDVFRAKRVQFSVLKRRSSRIWEPPCPSGPPSMFYLAGAMRVRLSSLIPLPHSEEVSQMVAEASSSERKDEHFFSLLDQAAREDKRYLPVITKYVESLKGRVIHIIHDLDNDYAYGDAYGVVVEDVRGGEVKLDGEWGELSTLLWYIPLIAAQV